MTVVAEYFNRAINRWEVRLADGRRTYRYRWIMEQHLGRRLLTGEHVHHVNGDSTDDRLENLRVLSPAEHHALHGQDVSAAIRADWAHDWSAEHACCVECSTVDRPHMAKGLCSRCYFTLRARAVNGHSPRQPATVLDLTCAECDAPFQRTLSQGRATYCSRSCASRATAKARWARAAA